MKGSYISFFGSIINQGNYQLYVIFRIDINYDVLKLLILKYHFCITPNVITNDVIAIATNITDVHSIEANSQGFKSIFRMSDTSRG